MGNEPLKKFFYQIKVAADRGYHSDWERVWFDIIEAKDKNHAREIISKEHNAIIVEKVSARTKKPYDYRAFIVELSESYEKFWLTERECKNCKRIYTTLEQKKCGEEANEETCSSQCYAAMKPVRVFDASYGPSYHAPVIYRILNRSSNMSYIGQTTQAFTLRWYQHLFHPTDTKFHRAIKNSKNTDWQFEILEEFDKGAARQKLNEREQYWINHFDSIQSGYNTATAKKESEDEE